MSPPSAPSSETKPGATSSSGIGRAVLTAPMPVDGGERGRPGGGTPSCFEASVVGEKIFGVAGMRFIAGSCFEGVEGSGG